MAAKPIETKILQLKALLGDEAAKSVLDEADKREKAAQEAGVDFKEVATKDDKKTDQEQVPLSELLKEIEAGLESGQVINDLEEDNEVPEGDPEEEVKALKEFIGQVFDEKFEALVEKLGTKDKKDEDKQEARIKELQDQITTAQAALKELGEGQPKQRPFRASQADDTLRQKSKSAETPGPDPVGTFISDFVLGGNGANQP